jgi:UDP-N-acetylmuramoyl-L-alanyl-D-glutamate--2,6-diaminopimelate ligase
MSLERSARAGFPLDRLLAGICAHDETPALEIRGLCHDSRAARPGDLFAALAGGRSHGMKHAAQAIAGGAAAVVFDPAHGGRELARAVTGIPCFATEDLSHKLGIVADRFFGEPSKALAIIGVTGTNGKTSCSHFLAQASGDERPGAVIGTLGWGAPGALSATAHTTPDAIEVHALLARLRDQGFGLVAMEASSHGLAQGRLNGVRFRGGLFTNLSRDHLDYHGDMSAYLEAKLRLVAWPGLEFLAFNLDDASAEAILRRTPKQVRKLGFTLKNSDFKHPGMEIVRGANIRCEQGGVAFDAHFGDARAPVEAPVYGEFNAANLLGALAVQIGLGTDLEEAALRLRRARPTPGRMECLGGGDAPLAVVDYAHTPDALEKALTSLRRHCRGALWAVFGCGGDRDSGKRPQMGAIAERLADRVVLTDDNPRSERGDAIVQDILAGCKGGKTFVQRDRRLAIAYALERAGPEDVVLVAGKGHEDYQEIGGARLPFSDRAVLLEYLHGKDART